MDIDKFKIIILVHIISLTSFQGYGQDNTIGLLLCQEASHSGYVLFSPIRNRTAYLINNCGQVINEWETDNFPNRMSYLKPNGNLIRATLNNKVEERNWDNEVLWEFDFTTLGYDIHHDMALMPNGNVLIMATELIPEETLLDLGRASDIIDQGLLSEVIVELEFDGMRVDTIWSWRLIDHIVQNRDSLLPGFGELSSSPSLMNLNFVYQDDLVDWVHFNSIDYDSELDQILLSARHTSELYVIDHNLSTAEASTNTAGDFGVGGGFLWRWGNPLVYGIGSEVDRDCYGQHDGRWVRTGESLQISIFNNGDERDGDYSSVHTLSPMVIPNLSYSRNADGVFLPESFEWSFDEQSSSSRIFSFIEGGLQAISESDFIISESATGRMIQMSRNGEIKWIYRNPVNVSILEQYDELSFGPDFFKSIYLSSDYFNFDVLKGFEGQIIENENSLSDDCISSKTSVLFGLESDDIDKDVFISGPKRIIFSKIYSGNVFDFYGNNLIYFENQDVLDLSAYPIGSLFIIQLDN